MQALPPAPRGRPRGTVALPVVAAVVTVVTLVLPFVPLRLMVESYEGEVAAYGIQAAAAAIVATVVCWAGALVAVVLAIVAMALRRPLVGLSIGALTVALVAATVGPWVYVVAAFGADVY